MGIILVRDTYVPFFDRLRHVLDLAYALRWLKQAENDFEFASLGLSNGFYAQVCFQSQQVCEKALKSIHYGHLGRRVVLGHSLVELAKDLDVPAVLVDKLAILDQYYVPTRYPNGLPGAVPFQVYKKIQAEQALVVCREVLELAREKLPG